MNYRKMLLALAVGALLLVLLSIWIPWQAFVVLFFLVVIAPSPFGRQPRQFIKRKIQAHRIISEYERQRHPAQPGSQRPTGTGSFGLSPGTPAPEYEQGYQGQIPASSANWLPYPGPSHSDQPKQDSPSIYYDQPLVQYPEAPPPMH